jgi:large subunit ribosomal protein L3
MAMGLIGRKVGMTQIFGESSEVTVVTLIEAGPCMVTGVRTPDKHGYHALQLGYMDVSKRKATKPYRGQFPDNLPPKRHLKEFRLKEGDKYEYNIADIVNVDIFEAGEKVDVRGTTKGQGFQGVVKRFGFSGGPKSHGSHFKRLIGSVGASASPSKIMKGMKMPGNMGNVNVSQQNLQIVKIDPENHIIAVKGSIPGPNNGIVYVTKAAKKPAKKVK